MHNILQPIVLCATIISLAGCAALPSTLSRPTLSYVSPTSKDLQQLPPPKGKIVAAVYGFRDQTGQYQPSTGGTNFSTAVTQGGASLLVQTLRQSNWFLPVERESLNNLLTERKIYRAAREKQQQTQTKSIPKTGVPQGGSAGTAAVTSSVNIDPPSLLSAVIMIDGGIIGYDSNTRTGGIGANYFGIGATADYQQDRVTIVLRAINVETGEIIDSVSVTKTILSQVLDVSFYQFISFAKLLQIETGFSANEPVHADTKQ